MQTSASACGSQWVWTLSYDYHEDRTPTPSARGPPASRPQYFRHGQDRLPKELELAGISDIDAANGFIREVYLPAHNARFARAPQIAESARSLSTASPALGVKK
jgi:hypothetical protein